MKEHEFEMWSEIDSAVYVIQASIRDDGQCDMWISHAGIRQDVYPLDVGKQAAKLWLEWLVAA